MSFVVAATGAGSVPSPSGAAVGDLALYITRGNSATTPPAGWTEVADGQANSGNFYSFGWKTLVSADLSGTWAWSGASVVSVAVYRNIAGAPSFDTETKLTTLTAGSATLPSVGPAPANDTIVRLIGIATNFTPGITWTAGATSRTTGSGGGFWSTAVGDNDVASGGSTGGATATFGNGSCDYIYTSVTLTLATAASGSLTLTGSVGGRASAAAAGALTLAGSAAAPLITTGHLDLGSPAAAARPVYLASFTVDVGMEASDIPLLAADVPTVDYVGDDFSDLVDYPDPTLDQYGRPIAS